MSRTPNYRLTEDYNVSSAYNNGLFNAEYKIIPQGSYVRPIELPYIPNHVIDDKRWKFFNKEIEIFCYTKFGIVPIPRKLLVGE